MSRPPISTATVQDHQPTPISSDTARETPVIVFRFFEVAITRTWRLAQDIAQGGSEI